ncbi:MAG: aldo/keto reductase [Deinococcales bacterium]|jgi:aryl-alcohol dehydrogenase-like predicted oxidoreductase
MELRPLGRTGVQVSSLCFGTMSFGTTADEAESGRMFRRCLDAGVNFFDTANVYGRGLSETILGRLMREHRDELVVASKGFGSMSDDPNDRGLSRRNLTRAVEASLRRLGTDRLDVYYVHHFDPLTPIDEALRALDHLVQRGLVLYPAVSNWAAWQIEKALGISAREQLARFEVVQPMYSLAKRQVEVEILPMAQAERLAVVPYSPLGGGLLSGKYGTDRRPENGRLIENAMYASRYGGERYLRVADALTAYAREQDVHPATLAVAWVRSHPAVTAPIVGARDVAQLEPSLAAADLVMAPEMRAELSALTPAPPPATDRSEERTPAGS